MVEAQKMYSIVLTFYNLTSPENSLSKSYLTELMNEGFFKSKSLRVFSKFQFFDDDQYQKVQFKDLRTFTESTLRQFSGGSNQAGGMGGMMSMLQSMMGGGDDAQGADGLGNLASLLGGGGANAGSADGPDELQELMRSLTAAQGSRNN